MLDGISAEIAESLELAYKSAFRCGQRRFDPSGHGLQGIGIEKSHDVVGTTRIRIGEKPVVKAHLGSNRIGRSHPVYRALHLPVARSRTAASVRIVGAVQLDYLPCIVLDHFITTNDVRIAQSHLTSWLEAKVLSRRIL